MTQHAQEISSGQRFAFGENWTRFLSTLQENRIAEAEASLEKMLGSGSLRGRTFLDIGCGSGLFSLAARRLGARVHSFDYDPHSVACATELRRRYFPDDPNWRVEEGSALDPRYLESLGKFDVVYSWGVLHHTGAMWEALHNAALAVAPGGRLFVAIYNDQGSASRRWLAIKRCYNRMPAQLRFVLLWGVLVQTWWRRSLKDLLHLRPFASWRQEARERGMSAWYDLVDWVGGYPFEVAKPEQIFEFYKERGFTLEEITTCGGSMGCNEFVFLNSAAS
jgi:2-polyprenyl-6-hydroxyphenyl methylase/3-demethylubiquinone-9 3-methyltransferase